MRSASLRRSAGAALVSLAVAACGGAASTQAPGGTGGAPTTGPATAAPATQSPAGTAAPTQAAATSDPFAFASQFEGTYSGTWTNTTFGSTGPASIELALDRAAGAMDMLLTLGGNIFGQPTPAPETLRAQLVPGEGLSFESATFGETTVSVDLSGAAPVITVSSPDVPSARIKTFTATATIGDPRTIELAYEVAFRDATPPASGTATLTR
jgi:hypothetical protein